MNTLELQNTKTNMQLKLKLTSPGEFTSFLKRYASISGSLLIEIDNGYLKAKTHTPERSVVKSSKIDLNRIFGQSSENITENVLFGVYNVDKLIKSFGHFEGTELTMIIQLDKTSDGIVGTDIILQNDTLKISFACASLRLFTHITDDMMNKISDTSSSEVHFVLTKELQGRIHNLAAIDSDQKLITLKLKDGKLSATGKSFDLNLLSIDNQSADLSVSVYKTQFAYLDREDAMVYMNEDRLICTSIETETKIVIGKAE